MIRSNVVKSPVSSVEISSLPPDYTVDAILAFLEKWFPDFREEYVSTMPSSLEDDISRSLHLFLQAKAKSNNFLFSFNGQKGVDFLILIQPLVLSAKPIFVIEAKRLPPTNNKDYVQGTTGGIERFKREQAGFTFDRNQCAMVAYVQKHTFNRWFEQINYWITELIVDNQNRIEIEWAEDDKLLELPSNSEYVSKFISRHSRKTLPILTIRHFWLNMQQKTVPIANLNRNQAFS